MMAVTILESGLASCVTEPRCRHNLEGYGMSEPYRFERCQDEKGRYCQVFPDRSLPRYYISQLLALPMDISSHILTFATVCSRIASAVTNFIFALLASSPVKNWSKAYFEFVFRSQVFA